MKVIIAGSREGFTIDDIREAVQESGFIITEVVSGAARGVDRLGEQYARENKIPVSCMPADWDNLGKRAGYVRNAEMAEYADACILLIFNHSKGSTHMLNLANKKGIPVALKRKDEL